MSARRSPFFDRIVVQRGRLSGVCV